MSSINKGKSETFPERISYLIDILGSEYNLNQNDIAEAIGIKSSSLSGLKSGKSQRPSNLTISMFQKSFGVNPRWLKTGEGETFLEEVKALGQSAIEVAAQFTYIPFFDLSAGAGDGSIVDNEIVKKYLAFRTEWIQGALRVSPKDLALLEVLGDSMEPTLQNHDIMLIDCSQRNVVNGKVFCFRSGETLLVKRLEILITGDIVIKSDNRNYQETKVKPDDFNDIQIIGRVVWFGREL